MNRFASTDSIRIEGVAETAEVIGDDVTKHTCGKCGHVLQISGGIVINGSLEFVDGQKSVACPRCKEEIQIT